MSDQDGLLSAFVLDGQGAGRELDWDGVRQWTRDQGPLWVHLDRTNDSVRRWLTDHSGLDVVRCQALLAEDTRPRCTIMPDGALIILRGVNLNPGAEPDDMISLRVWVEPDRVISLRFPRLMAVEDVRAKMRAGGGPATTGELIVALANALSQRMAPVLENLDENIDRLEESVIEVRGPELRTELGRMRRQAITLRRYIAPQRDALAHLLSERPPFLSEIDRTHMREVIDRTTRYVEDLDELRERAVLIQEEVFARQSEQMNRTMYVLSMVATIFLPLGLITGLLGINVAGIPGESYPLAFMIVCGILVLLAAAEYLLFRRFRLL